MSEFLAGYQGRHVVLGVREPERLKLCGITTRWCVAKVAGAEELGLWLENPKWGSPHLAPPRTAYVLVRWEDVETLLLFPEDPFTEEELRCLAEAPERCRPIGFQPVAEADSAARGSGTSP
jgi:hypothetical protein